MRGAIDVELVGMGYLRSWDDRWRHIPSLEVIARDTAQLGVTVRWGRPAEARAGCAYLWTREIVLSYRLFEAPGWLVKLVWSHELSHFIAESRSEERVDMCQKRYAAAIQPAWVA